MSEKLVYYGEHWRTSRLHIIGYLMLSVGPHFMNRFERSNINSDPKDPEKSIKNIVFPFLVYGGY